jgi:hypothetical protein
MLKWALRKWGLGDALQSAGSGEFGGKADVNKVTNIPVSEAAGNSINLT